MQFPQNLASFINDFNRNLSEIELKPLDIMMLNSDPDIGEIDANLSSWKVISYDSRSIKVAL